MAARVQDTDAAPASKRHRGDVKHAMQQGTTLSGPAVLNAAIVRLLDDACSMLERDREAARSIIRRASSLLRAERQKTSTSERESARHGTLAPWQAQRVVRHIESALCERIRISDLASISRLSGSYFARAFKCSFGESPYGYILRRRLERAQEVMLATDEPLSQIALGCGFSDQAHMTKLFRQFVGDSPGAWRRSLRGPPEEADGDYTAGQSAIRRLEPDKAA
jgi:AraC family transcriptional regulator